MDKNKNNQLQIRNSTADFLIFTRQNGEDGIAVRVEDENMGLTSWKNAPHGKIIKTDVSRVIQDKTYRSDFDKLIEQTQAFNWE